MQVADLEWFAHHDGKRTRTHEAREVVQVLTGTSLAQ
jgi:hypothetical protein